jgi:hypothetical protein
MVRNIEQLRHREVLAAVILGGGKHTLTESFAQADRIIDEGGSERAMVKKPIGCVPDYPTLAEDFLAEVADTGGGGIISIAACGHLRSGWRDNHDL